MSYKNLKHFINTLENAGELVRIKEYVNPKLEITEITDRISKTNGPALLFENVRGSNVPVLANLFGTPGRVALGMGEEEVESLRGVGELLAFLKEPEPPRGMKDAWEKMPVFKQVLNMAPKEIKKAPCQQIVFEKDEVDLGNAAQVLVDLLGQPAEDDDGVRALRQQIPGGPAEWRP